MKQINFLATILLVLLFTSCGSKTKHIVTETGRCTLAEEEFTTYSVDNDYSISIPSFLKKENIDPDRYSLVLAHTDIDCSLDDISYWSIFIEEDTKEAYEARRNKEGNLDQYPFTLKGFLDVTTKTSDSSASVELIGSPIDLMINNMPAIARIAKTTIDLKVANLSVFLYVVGIEASNGKMYRMKIFYPLYEVENETDVPEWVTEMSHSFKVL